MVSKSTFETFTTQYRKISPQRKLPAAYLRYHSIFLDFDHRPNSLRIFLLLAACTTTLSHPADLPAVAIYIFSARALNPSGRILCARLVANGLR